MIPQRKAFVMLPTIGRIVHYRLSQADCEMINRRRADAQDKMSIHRSQKTGVMVHVGNAVHENDIYPLIITRVWGATEGSAVNGQVLLDGSDTLWVTSVVEGDATRTWFVPPRV